MTAFERRLKQAEEIAARQDAAAAKARRTVSTGLAKASTEKTGRATNAAGITTLPVFQVADGAFSGTGADRGTSSSGLKTGVNRGALTQERHAAATAGKTLQPGREKGIQMGFSQGLGYGTERAGAALLGAGENVTDLIGTGFYKGLQGITSLGGLAKNPVSEWAGREADAFLDNSVTRDWEEDIRARYQPTREEEQLTGLGQTVVQMLPAIATGSVAAKVLGTGLKAGQAANAGANVSRAVFGLQAAGGGANEARQEGADAGRALAYGAASGLLETTIESIAGGIPGMGEGKLRGIAEAVKASPIVSRVLDIAGEGGEEALSAILSPYLKRAIYDPDAENATAEEIAQSAILGAAAAGVLQAGLELPGAVSDVRSARAEVGSGADILSRVNQRLAQPGQVAADFQGLPMFEQSPFEGLPSFRRRSVETLPNFRQAQASVDTRGQNAVSDGAVEATGQNKTASTGETAQLLLPERSEIAKERGYPMRRNDAVYKVVEIPQAKVDEISAYIDTVDSASARKKYKRILKNLFSGQTFTNANTVANEIAYEIGISSRGIGEIIARQPVSAETLAMLEQLNEVVENAKYVASEPTSHENRRGIERTDLFETDTMVGDRPGVARMRVNVGKDGNKLYFATNKITEGDTPQPRADQGRQRGVEGGPSVSAPIIAENSAEGNTQSAQGGRKYTDDGVGAANAGFAGAYHQLQNQTGEGGFHPDGEKAARQVDVPKRDFDGRNIPKSAATVLEAEATPDSAVDVIQEAIAKGEFSFDTITDEAALKRARTTVEEKGWDGAMEQFHQAAASGTVNKDNTALGQVLLNNAMNVGNSRAVIDLLSDYSTMSTTAAQALQANRMLKKLSPEGQLYAVQRSLSSYQEELRRRMGDKAPEITVEPALYQEFLDAQDQTGREAALEAIYKDVAGQVPANWMDKWNAWRYLAMLGNPRTHIRNIVGNAAFAPVRMVKNAIGTALEAGVDYLSPRGIQRTKAALNPASSTDRGLVKAALADVANVEAQLLGEGKYSESAPGKIRDYQSIFALEPLEALRKFNGTAMDVEDTWFSKPAYAWALAGYLKANGVDAQALNDGTVDARLMDQARAYAIREAQRATYRDSNAFSEFVSGLRRKGNSPVDRAVNVLMEGVLPFRKTPANILMRGVEYSPAGLVKGLTYDLRQVQQGKMEAAQAIDDIAAGLTGTGLLALGAWLASMGLVSGGGSGDDEQDGMDDLAGGQDYALSVGGKNYTLDWLAPEALPFFVGVELFNTLTDKSEGGVSWKNIEAAANRIMDPMLEMSMLQGLQDAIDNVRYADGGTLPKVAANAALSYLAQGVPTLFGQIERTLEDKRYTTYVERTSGLPTDLQYTLGRTANKLPGEFQQVPYIDAWGRQEGSGSTAERAFNNFFNPAYVSRESETAADREIKRLLDAGQSGVAPQRTSQSTQVTYQEAGSGETHKRYLTAEEYVDYASVKGQTSFELVSAMMESEIYKSMTDEQKADAIKLAYTYANHVASEEVTDGRHVSEAYVELAQAAKKELGLSEAEYLLLYKEYGGSLVNGDEVREAYRQGMEAEEYLEYAAGAKGYNEDEKGNLTIAENAKAITQSGLSKGNQEIAWALAYPEWPEKAEEAGLSMAEYIQYKTATYGCKKKAEKLAALREAGLPVGWYYKVEK